MGSCEGCAYAGLGHEACRKCVNEDHYQVKTCDICTHLSEECNTSAVSCHNGSRFDLKKEVGAEDKVNHPKHYTSGKFETIDIIEDTLTVEEFKGFLAGNAIKYLSRARFKGGQEDIEKCIWYLRKWIEVVKRGKE